MTYGKGDATYQALGQEQGIRNLADSFYTIMAADQQYQTIWRMHKDDPATMRDKLSLFLCMWSGGPKTYLKKYGSINIPRVHSHLQVGTSEKDQWLSCMNRACKHLDYPEDLHTYLIQQLAIPAERVRVTSYALGL